ncbi:MAG: transposase [Caldilineales bacterium]|nr:transposase [Caldilineales bacterium]
MIWLSVESKNSRQFIRFLEHLPVARYRHEVAALVLDNASFHKSAAAMAALNLFEHRLWAFWQTFYCSTLNPIERFWRHLKDQICVNALYLLAH